MKMIVKMIIQTTMKIVRKMVGLYMQIKIVLFVCFYRVLYETKVTCFYYVFVCKLQISAVVL